MRLRKCCAQIVALAAVLASCGCQSAQRPSSLLPKQATPPALATAKSPGPSPQDSKTAPTHAPEPTPATVPKPSMDPVANLIGKVEKEYLAGQANYSAGHI